MIVLAALLAMGNGAPVVGDTVSPFTLATREGQSFSWRPRRTTVLCFCAFWCDTWKDQLPRIKEAQSALKGFPVDFLTISVDGRWSERGKLAAVGANLSDNGNRWCSSMGIDRVPYTLLVDPSGTIRWSTYGVLRSQELVSAARGAANGKSSAGTVYLTFDDFPATSGNEELLDALRKEHLPATFFCVCSRLQGSKDAVKRAVAEGHGLEIHAWIHDEPNTDLGRCQSVLGKFGGDGTLYRPHGSEYVVDWKRKARLGNPVVDPYDYQRPGVNELVRRISGHIGSGAIIQLHAGASDTVAALPIIAAKLRARGFTFGVLGR